MVVMVVEVGAMHPVIKLASGHRGSGQASIHTSLVECQRVLRYEHTDVRQDRCIVFGMAIAIRRDVQHERDVEVGTSVDDRLGIFRHFVVQELRRVEVGGIDGIEVTSRNA